MNKVKNRTMLALLLVALLAAGLVWYLVLFFTQGSAWVAFAPNRHIYQGGGLLAGVLTDRDGVVLVSTEGGRRVYHEDGTTRRALLHTVGDARGKIGTGAQTKFAAALVNYNPVGGLFAIDSTGGTVALTVDAAISAAAYRALGNYNGAVIAYNYKTGAILCQVSKPGYDPENPPADLESNPAYEGVYVNRALSALYTPGSVMKVMTTAAALENLPGFAERKFECTGSLTVGGGTVTCPTAHGTLTLAQALARSCNVTYAQISLELGGDVLADYAGRCGLTRSLNIDGIRTAAGRFDAHGDDTAQLAWSGVGQSTDLVTPAAMMVLMGAVGNGGTAVTPKLLPGTKAQSERYFSKDIAGALETLLYSNVTGVYGQSGFPKDGDGKTLKICAKSGTAQTGEGEPNAWFAGYIADERWPCAFAVVVERGGAGSGVAADAARALLRAVVDGK